MGIAEVLWIRRIFGDLEILYEEPIKVHCDNKMAISIAHDPIYDGELFLNMNTRVLSEPILLLLLIHQLERLSIY